MGPMVAASRIGIRKTTARKADTTVALMSTSGGTVRVSRLSKQAGGLRFN